MKTRVTKKAIKREKQKRKEQKALTPYQAKKRILPGPWTEMKTPITVKPKLYANPNTTVAQLYGAVPGTYSTATQPQKGWYDVVFNIQADNKLIEKHSLDLYLAAVERALNKDPIYSTIILTRVGAYNPDHEVPYISCRARTNQKNLPHFRAVRKKKLITIAPKMSKKVTQN